MALNKHALLNIAAYNLLNALNIIIAKRSINNYYVLLFITNQFQEIKTTIIELWACGPISDSRRNLVSLRIR